MGNVVIIPSFKKDLDNLRNREHLRIILKTLEKIKNYGLKPLKILYSKDNYLLCEAKF